MYYCRTTVLYYCGTTDCTAVLYDEFVPGIRLVCPVRRHCRGCRDGAPWCAPRASVNTSRRAFSTLLSLHLNISVHLFCLFMNPLSCFQTRLLAFSRKSHCRRRQTRPVGVTCGASTTAMPARTAARGAISTTRRSKTASHLGTVFDKWRRERGLGMR